MKNITLVLILSFSQLVLANKPHHHRQHLAHAHGAGTLGIVFEGVKGQVELKIPSESIMGFEHAPKTEKDKKTKTDSLLKLENQISEMLVFDNSLGCKWMKNKLDVVAESAKHSEVHAVFGIECNRSPLGSELTFAFQKSFPRIKILQAQVVIDNLQKSIEVKKDFSKLILN